MNTKHTQGEWYIQFMDKNDPNSDFWIKSDTNPVVHYGTDIMCEDYGEHNGYPREQRMADAKLRKAAPELLRLAYAVVNGMKTRDELEIAAEQVIYKTKP